jgi:adenosine/AMP kinase
MAVGFFVRVDSHGRFGFNLVVGGVIEMEIQRVKIDIPEGANVIAGQTHFIKTVEDLYEVFKNSVPTIKFGIGFCEASQDRLVRWDGNDDDLAEAATDAAKRVGAGHFFIAFIRDAFPINVLPAIKMCPEVCSIFCATANPIELLVVESGEMRGVVGVLDGMRPLGVEGDEDRKKRKRFLRDIGYKVGE